MEGHARQDRFVKRVAFFAKVGDDPTGNLVAVKLVKSSSRLIQSLTSETPMGLVMGTSLKGTKGGADAKDEGGASN